MLHLQFPGLLLFYPEIAAAVKKNSPPSSSIKTTMRKKCQKTNLAGHKISTKVAN